MYQLVAEAGLQDEITIDSAGTIDYHTGNPPDLRMSRAARKRGIEMRGAARQIRRDDLQTFDLVLVMDEDNYANVKRIRDGLSNPRARLVRFCDFCPNSEHKVVPDPYYGGDAGFELVLDLMEEGCQEILRQYLEGTLTDG